MDCNIEHCKLKEACVKAHMFYKPPCAFTPTPRITEKETPMTADHASDADMVLPEGKTCKECVHFRRCSKLVGAKDIWVICDFAPSRFQEATNA